MNKQTRSRDLGRGKKIVHSFTFSPEAYEILRELAEIDKRSMSSWLENMVFLMKDVKEMEENEEKNQNSYERK